MAKGGSYTTIAKGMPSASTTAGVDNHKVVGGGPSGGSTPKGSTVNKGKMKGQY
jgi:hypothetical protein